MNLLLPVDSRVENTQGFIILDTKSKEITEFETFEKFNFVRKGFRGACIVDKKIIVCNSYSIKIYHVNGDSFKNISFDLYKQIQYPEWLLGRGANADLHMIHFSATKNKLFLANSFMDCVDILSVEGLLLERKFLWEISEYIMNLLPSRNQEIPDFCHINHIESIAGEIVLTLGNINGTGIGALINYRNGNVILDNLARPHDGIYFENKYYITETSKYRILIYNDIYSISDFDISKCEIIDLSAELTFGGNHFWARGLHITKENIYVGCSQFQDRNNNKSDSQPSHILVLDRKSLQVVNKLPVPSLDKLKRPVLFSLLDLDAVFK